jgi:hypothetical protein
MSRVTLSGLESPEIGRLFAAAPPRMPFPDDVAWLWAMVAQAALCQCAQAQLDHAQWLDFRALLRALLGLDRPPAEEDAP